MTYLLSPISLGILITFHLISSLTYLVMKIGATLVMRTFSFPLPLLAPVTQNSVLFQFGCPEDSADPSPDHSIMICNSSTRHSSCSGPSLSLADWHSTLTTGRTVWQCYHTHSPTLPFSLTSFLVFSSAGLLFGPWKSFLSGEAVKNSFNTLIANPSPGIAAWRFPPHSLSLNTISTLLTTFRSTEFSVLKVSGMVPDGLPWQVLLLTNISNQSLFSFPSEV